jgi:hypothetical protein
MSRPSVFLSYSERDAKLGKRVETELKHLGLEALNAARAVRAGDDWRKAIQAAIKRADALIVLVLTPQFLSSSWMSYEVGIAEALGKVVMTLLANKHSVSELPADFASTQIIEFDPLASERAAHDIASRLAMA